MDEIKLEKDDEGIPFIKIQNYELKLDLTDLDEHFKERALNEIRETPEIVANGVKELRKMVATEKHLRLPEDDTFLYKFLRPCKFYPDSSFRLLTKYYMFIAKNPKYAGNLVPNTVRDVYANEIIEFLPLRVKGSRVMIFNMRNWNAKEIGVDLLFKAIIMAIEIACIEPKTQVGGVHVILDMAGLNLQQIVQFSPWLAKLIMDFVQGCTPVRLKAIHVVNQPLIFNMIFAIFKPFIGDKLKERLKLHGEKWENLMKFIPKDFLPIRYGGALDIPTVPGPLLVELLNHYTKDYEELLQWGYFFDGENSVS